MKLCPLAAHSDCSHVAAGVAFCGHKTLLRISVANSRISWSTTGFTRPGKLRVNIQRLTTSRNQRSCGLLCRVVDTDGSSCTEETDIRESDYLKVQGVNYVSPGTANTLLQNVNLSLPEKSLGLIYGRSGSGKTTLLHVLAGLARPTDGSVVVGADTFGPSRNKGQSLSSRAGIVFQFPERYFVADTILEELVFGWPRRTQDEELRRMLSLRLQNAIYAVGLQGVPLDSSPRALSDGFKRRLALAVQLVRMPDLLLLDEPLAGLDWMARAEVVKLLSTLKQSQTLVVVSHDLKELVPLVDRAWQMEMGGVLSEQPWPP